MRLPKEVENALDQAWNRVVAENSMERWLNLCEQEEWVDAPKNLPLLTRIFGASWYFTRFIFVNGSDIANLVDQPPPASFTTGACEQILQDALTLEGMDAGLERLRILKNRIMLQILIARLTEEFDQEKTEHALTCLAEATLGVIMRLQRLTPEYAANPISILGMGRMAGYEMTFGSDLDIIFLYGGDGADLDPQTERGIRLLLRNIAAQSPVGLLYEVDMRLRPHGNAGVLLTSLKSFLEYHGRERDIWERQMMTRCRILLDSDGSVQTLMNKVNGQIYARYDKRHLRSEIISMRQRVQKELGSPAGKYEIKRGRGGIMDIDFITHYYQLAYGHDNPELQTGSTREVLRRAADLEIMDRGDSADLLEAYDFLKQVETSLRLFDMKPISAFPASPQANTALARALGFASGEEEAFIHRYEAVTGSVRERFCRILES
jgi:glutamate-ammonia-ligase adenylyltransferase